MQKNVEKLEKKGHIMQTRTSWALVTCLCLVCSAAFLLTVSCGDSASPGGGKSSSDAPPKRAGVPAKPGISLVSAAADGVTLEITPPAQAAKPGISLVSAAADGVTLEITPPAQAKTGTVEAQLYDLGGKLLAKAARDHQGRPVKVKLAAAVNHKDLADYYVRYRLGAGDKFHRRSLYFMSEILETTVLGQRDLLAGTSPVVRALVRDRASGDVVPGAAVSVQLMHKGKQIAGYDGRTDERGEVTAQLKLPDAELRGAVLKLNVVSLTAKDTVTQTVNIKAATRTLLTTDKPLYQPGQTIHIRALSLRRSDMKPLANSEVTLEVEDAKGNKVFKRAVKTNAYGISHADFVLADELNKGTYRVRAVVGKAKEEKTVTVDRYVLPKFKVKFKTDRRFYKPGETVKVELQVDYIFGKPVAGGEVNVKCSKFDVAYVDFQTVDGKTDKNGHYAFEVALPKHFVGQPLEAGKASAKFEISVMDTADHKEKVTRNVSVTASPIMVAAVPESGELIAGLENEVYVITTYADATPAKCEVVWTNPPDGKSVTISTDEAGFGKLTVTPAKRGGISMSLSARDAKGMAGKATIALKPKATTGDDTVLLRTNRSLLRVGDKLELSVFSTRKSSPVYVDVIKDRQTYMTRTLELKDNKAVGQITLDAALAGTVQINAYLIGANGVIVRDRRLAIVDPADDLRISVSADRKTYLPAGNAKVSFQVSDSSGRGVPSALGVMVVDEAVFALQEMQPGLEKIYFYLEKEIATPRYEIHGYTLDGCIMPGPGPMPLPMPAAEARRDKAARVLLASAKGAGKHTLHVNTYKRDNKGAAYQVKMLKVMAPRYTKVVAAMKKLSQKLRKDKKNRLKKGIDLAVLIEKGYLKAEDALDPWGTAMKMSGNWCQGCQNYHGFGLLSAGIDGKWGTADDVADPRKMRRAGLGRGKGAQLMGAMNGVAGADMVMAEAAPAMALRKVAAAKKPMAQPPAAPKNGGSGHASGSGAAAKPVRIRQFFPETLYFKPAVITDERGKALLDIPLADSITTWRLTCMASSARGQLGSTTAGIRVFQDFFVDIDFPVALTQNDEVSVPVAIYNYLKSDQEIRLTVTKEDWFDLRCPPTVKLTLRPSEVRAVYFPIVARKIGFQKFTVTARGSKKSDAVARSVQIVPDGKEFLISHSGRLKGDVTHVITIPDGAIPDASKIFVKVYPGTLSQVAEGLDKMLRMPFGCFEQTSSVTYPNILVLDYMKTTGKITPALQMKAQGFINAGYQRLLSFEVAGGGFEWFGKAPAHRILTAYGLMEFHDMSKVHEVDPSVISRTQQWLAKLQDKDGSYKPSKGGIAEGAINKFRDDVFRNTAYITWALASTGYQGPQVAKGIAYLRSRLDDIKDTYTLALTANAFASVDPKGKTTVAVLDALLAKRKDADDVVYWPATSATPTHGRGSCGDIEVTGLAIQAFVKCERELGTVSKAVGYLVTKKDAYGTWQSTQATIQAMRGMLMAERGATVAADANITVSHDTKPVKELRVDKTNSDVLQLVDLKDLTRKGKNTVSLVMKGKGSLMYQVVGRYYLPYPRKVGPGAKEPITITVDYDRKNLATEDIITAKATVTNNRRGTAKMIIVDLGLPPGFTLLPDNLNQAVKAKDIEKYSTTGRQVIVYLRELKGGEPVSIQYQLRAKYPLKAKTAKSVAYEYYNPEIRAEAKPVLITVTK